MAPPRPTTGLFSVGSGLGTPPKATPKKPAPKSKFANPTIVDRAPPTPAKKNPLPTTFRAPPVSQVIGDVPLLPPGPPLKEPDRLAVAQVAHALKVAAIQQKAEDARIVSQRQTQSLVDNAIKDVAAKHGLTPPGAPFQGVTGAPAKLEHAAFDPTLTADVGLSRARMQLLHQGGLGLTPDQHLQQSLARLHKSQGIQDKPSFLDTHRLPDEVARSWHPTDFVAPQPTQDPGFGGGGAWDAPTGEQAAERATAPPPPDKGNPRQQMLDNQPGQSDLSSWANLGQDTSWEHAFRNVLDLGENRSWKTSTSRIGGAALDSLNLLDNSKDNARTMSFQDAAAGKGPSFSKAAGKLVSDVNNIGLSRPDRVPIGAVVGGWQAINRAIHTKGVGTASSLAADGKTVDAATAAAIGFTPAYTKLLYGMAKKRGWYDGELLGLIGTDLMNHAYSDPPVHGLRELQNFGRGAAQTAAATAGMAGLAGELIGGNRTLALKQLGEGLKAEGLAWADHPLQSALSDPFTFLPAVGVAGKTAGLIGYARRGEMAMREIETGLNRVALHEGELGPASPAGTMLHGRPEVPMVYRKGQYSRNAWTHAGERMVDAVSRRLPNHLHAKQFDNHVRRAVNEAAHGHVVRQVAYRTALRKLDGHLSGKKKRAEILLAHLHAGGAPDVILKFYEDKLAGHLSEEGKAALQEYSTATGTRLTGAEKGQARFLRETVIPAVQNLNPSDHAFIAAARDLASHTSMTHIGLGRFRHAAMKYRALEPLLASYASRFTHHGTFASTPMEEAAHEIMKPGGLRDQALEKIPANAPENSARIAPRRGKISEATRQEGKGEAWHAEQIAKAEAEAAKIGPRPVDAGAAPHKAAEEAHKASRPVKPPVAPKGPQGTHATKYAAGKAGKAERDKYGAIGVKVREVKPTTTPGKVETIVGTVKRKTRTEAADDAAKAAAAIRKQHKGEPGWTVHSVTGGVRKDGNKWEHFIEVKHPDVTTPGHFTHELIHPPKAPDPAMAAYRVKLKKWLAKNPKPTSNARDLKAWEAGKPKPPRTPHSIALEKHAAKRPVRNPAELKAHDDAVTKWRNDTQVAKRKVAEAKAAARAHRQNSGAAGKRKRNLTEAERQQFQDVPDHASIYRHYEQALDEFLQMHLDSGGIAPARIAYTKARLKTATRAAARGGAKLNIKDSARNAPPVYRSTGSTFSGGNFLIDANSPIRESLHAQRLRTGLGVHKLLVDHVAQVVDQGTEIPEDMVAVSMKNMATLAPAEHVMDDNLVSHQASYEGETALRKKRVTDLESMAVKGSKTGDVTTKEPSYLVPRATWDRMLDWTRPVAQNRYDKFMREYQRALISIFPGTVIGNTIGSIPLALAAGAGPRSLKMAERTMRRGGHNRELAPHYLYGTGPSGHLEVDAHQFWTHGMNTMRRYSITGEDFSRVAAYWSKALPIVKREGKRIKAEAEQARKDWEKTNREFVGPRPGKPQPAEPYTRFGTNADHATHDVPRPVTRSEPDFGVPPEVLSTEQAFEAAAKGFASGKIKPELLDKVLDHVEKFMSDTHKPNGAWGRAVQSTHIILFQNWVSHMAKLVLYSLPIKHPRRMLFINTMARYGDQYRQEHGAWPAWMTGFVPLFHETSKIPGIEKLPGGAEVQHWSHVFTLMNLTPQATGGGLAQSLTDDTKSPFDRVAGVASPVFQLVSDLEKAATLNPTLPGDKQVNMPLAALNALLGTIPGERKLFPQQGLRADSIPFRPIRKTYTDPVSGQLLSPFLAPGPRVDHGWSGLLERIFGFGGYQVPNEGPINRQSIDANEIYNLPDPSGEVRLQIRKEQRQALQAAAAKAANGP